MVIVNNLPPMMPAAVAPTPGLAPILPHMNNRHRDFWWNFVGFVFLSCYHFWWLALVNLFTGVNVATMTVPPASLEMFGKYYRPVWGVICGLLQVRLASCACMCFLLFLLFSGTYP